MTSARRRLLLPAAGTAAALLAGGLSMWAWGPGLETTSRGAATVSPISRSQESSIAARSGTKVTTGGAVQKPPSVRLPGEKAPSFSLSKVPGSGAAPGTGPGGSVSGGSSSAPGGSGSGALSGGTSTGGSSVGVSSPSRPTVVDFMAGWCVQCLVAERSAEQVYRQYAGQVDFVGVDAGESASAAAAFVTSEGLTFPVGLDPDQKVAQSYGVIGLPQVFFVEPGGTIEHHVFGPLSPSAFDAAIHQLLDASQR